MYFVMVALLWFFGCSKNFMISLLLHSYLTNALLRIVTGQIFFLIISKKCRKNGEKKKISKQLFYNIERDHRFNRHDTPFDFFLLFFPFLLLHRNSFVLFWFYYELLDTFFYQNNLVSIFFDVYYRTHMYTIRKRLKRGIYR